MSAGDTLVTTVEEGLNTMVANARTTREFPADVMLKVVDRQQLTEGSGTSWREFLAATLTAQSYGEADVIDNPQELDGSILEFTPQLVAIHTFIGDRVKMRVSQKAFATFGKLNYDAIARKKAQDGLSLFATATTTLAGTGVTLTSGHVLAGIRRITSDADEPGPMPICAVLHGYQLYDLQSEILAGIGSYPIPEGYTKEVYTAGYKGMLGDANIYEDGLIAVDATPDVRGAVFSHKAIVLVEGKSLWTDKRYEPQKGYGGWSMWIKDEYVFGERSVGNWLYGILSDGAAPTS